MSSSSSLLSQMTMAFLSLSPKYYKTSRPDTEKTPSGSYSAQSPATYMATTISSRSNLNGHVCKKTDENGVVVEEGLEPALRMAISLLICI